MKIERGAAHTSYGYWTVLVAEGELVVASGRKYPFSTWIGTIREDGRLNVWTPASYKPRGYHAAARALLEQARDQLRASGDVK